MLPDLRAKREECALQMNELAGHSNSAGRDAEPAQAVIRGPPADAGGAPPDACAGVGARGARGGIGRLPAKATLPAR